MNTRANYVAVGAFVLVLLAGIFVAILWLARVQFGTEYTSYETHITGAVTGLSRGALVRLNGIEVGLVTGIDLDPNDPQRVTLIMQVRKAVTIRADATASLETQGFTGVEYVEISGGTLGAPPLVAAKGQRYPTIASRPSSLQQVFDNTPELLNRLMALSDRLSSSLGQKNQQAIADTLANVQETTGVFAHRTRDIDQLIVDSGQALHNLAVSSASLQGTLGKLDRTSDQADRLAVEAGQALHQATRLATHLDAVVVSSKPGLHDLTTNGTAQLSEILEEAHRLLESLNRVSTALERDPSRFLFGDQNAGYRPR